MIFASQLADALRGVGRFFFVIQGSWVSRSLLVIFASQLADALRGVGRFFFVIQGSWVSR
ncbi:MAG: hypothetical protein EBV06_15255 [Planctomycetia bacterium]|nr:hypothetical protein [Planctomycetia bacterium]